jgi:hypothetical protein
VTALGRARPARRGSSSGSGARIGGYGFVVVFVPTVS